MKAQTLLLLCAGLNAGQLAARSHLSFREEQFRFPRVRTAAAEKDQAFRRKQELSYPPRTILLRAFKKERQLELWAEESQGKAYALVKTYPICATSGRLGPKRVFGDEQVPEDFTNWTGSIRRATST
jgi:murein L,D-transpeptidase YafK